MENLDEQPVHADDQKALSQISGSVPWDARSALDDAYHLGRIRGRVDVAEAFVGKSAA